LVRGFIKNYLKIKKLYYFLKTMLVIRFLRKGKKNQAFFKIVVTDKKNPPRGGRFLETVGFFNPKTKEKAIKKERVEYWLGNGAQPSDTVYNLLVSEQIIKAKKKPVHKKSKKQAPADALHATAIPATSTPDPVATVVTEPATLSAMPEPSTTPHEPTATTEPATPSAPTKENLSA
jgi:small subunit ribosomal protein S16